MPTTEAIDETAVRWGANVRGARIRAGLTQAELADECELNQFTISRIETGENRPADETKLALARVFETRVELLFPYPHPTGGWPS